MSASDFDFVAGCIAAHPQMMGGQHVAMHCTAVIAIHKATGIAFRVDDERSQYKAKLRAVDGVRRLLDDRSALYTLAHNLQVGAALVMAYCEGCDECGSWGPGNGDVFPGWRPNVDGKGV